MKNTAILAYMAASAALVSAGTSEVDTGGITINPDGSYTCAKANSAYCAGDSLKTDIIIRCYGTRGVAGRCSNNLAGEPPVGVSTALCHQTDNLEGDAACEKNCVVYGGSGNGKGTFTLPAEICTPTYTATTSTASATSTSAASSSSHHTSVSTSTEYPHSSSKTTTHSEYPPHPSTKTHIKPPHSYPHHWPTTKKEDCTTGEETKTISYPTFISTTAYSSHTYVPSSSSVIYPTGGNSTIVTKTTAPPPPPPVTSGTAIPSGPTTTASNTPVPAGAPHNTGAAGAALALVGLVAAYIL